MAGLIIYYDGSEVGRFTDWQLDGRYIRTEDSGIPLTDGMVLEVALDAQSDQQVRYGERSAVPEGERRSSVRSGAVVEQAGEDGLLIRLDDLEPFRIE